jgi:hypothetical protein
MPAPAWDVFPLCHEELHLTGHGHPVQPINVNQNLIHKTWLKSSIFSRWPEICAGLLHDENLISHDVTGDESWFISVYFLIAVGL